LLAPGFAEHLRIELALAFITLVGFGERPQLVVPDLAGVWDNPATSPEVKKRIARTLVK
jgi:hypothetical protein